MKDNIGKRVELHPATDHWMQGDRYGEIIALGRAHKYYDVLSDKFCESPRYLVKLDKSGKTVRFNACDIKEIFDK